jgi:hypothetical protein
MVVKNKEVKEKAYAKKSLLKNSTIKFYTFSCLLCFFPTP